MSILIKNMKMPKCCDVCQFCTWSSFHQTAACEVHDNDPCFDNFSVEYREKRSNICPLVEFPKIKWTSISEKLPDENIDVFCKTESGFRTIASYGQLYPNDEEKGWITAEFNRFQTNFFAKWRPIIEDDD